MLLNWYEYVLGIKDEMSITELSEQWCLAIVITGKDCINESTTDLHLLVVMLSAFSEIEDLLLVILLNHIQSDQSSFEYALYHLELHEQTVQGCSLLEDGGHMQAYLFGFANIHCLVLSAYAERYCGGAPSLCHARPLVCLG